MPGETTPRNVDQRDATIDEFLTCSGATIREGVGEAYYRPGDDSISLPGFAAFKNAAHFYATAFHELGHYAVSWIMPHGLCASLRSRHSFCFDSA